jgi:hypothetical protein
MNQVLFQREGVLCSVLPSPPAIQCSNGHTVCTGMWEVVSQRWPWSPRIPSQGADLNIECSRYTACTMSKRWPCTAAWWTNMRNNIDTVAAPGIERSYRSHANQEKLPELLEVSCCCIGKARRGLKILRKYNTVSQVRRARATGASFEASDKRPAGLGGAPLKVGVARLPGREDPRCAWKWWYWLIFLQAWKVAELLWYAVANRQLHAAWCQPTLYSRA